MHRNTVDRIERQVIKGQRRSSMHVGVSRSHIIDQRGNGSTLPKLLAVLRPVTAISDSDTQVRTKVFVSGAHCKNLMISFVLIYKS